VLVLVIACANLASVQLARAFGRSHEFAVRAALGASRLDLMGPLLAESVLLTLAGGAMGVLLAFWANRLISHYFGGNLEIPIDGRVVLFATAAALITALTFGFAPAWRASRVSTGDALKENSRGSTSNRAQRNLKFGLIVGQLALALLLVSAATSFGAGVRNFLHRDLGWRLAGLISGDLNVPYEPYKADGKKVALMRALQEKLRQIPGVSRVSLASGVPLYGYPDRGNLVVEGAAPVPVGQEPMAFVSEVDGGFWTTLGIPLKEGRFLPETFKEGDPAFIVINESMARRFWPGQSAIGRRIKFTNEPAWHEVIGVVGDISLATNFETPPSRLQIYRGLQTVSNIWYNFVLQSALPPEALVGPIRKAIRDIDPDLMVGQLGGVTQIIEDMLAGNNLMIVTLGAFAFVGLLIALIGLYSVISQLTQQRSREIGIRMALGADARAVVRLILGQGGRLILAGVVAGLGGAYAVGVIYRQTMPELPPPGLAMQAGITLLLSVAGLAACYLPARRASRTNPVEALRAE
jgi:putative ABC transport system permease protein